MSDLVGYLDYLRFHHVSDESLKDKDHLKNEAFMIYERKVYNMAIVPLGFQLMQMYYSNNPATR